MVLHEDYIYSGRCTFPWPLTLSDSAFHLLRSNSPCKEKFGLCKRWWTCSQIPKNLRKRRDETNILLEIPSTSGNACTCLEGPRLVKKAIQVPKTSEKTDLRKKAILDMVGGFRKNPERKRK